MEGAVVAPPPALRAVTYGHLPEPCVAYPLAYAEATEPVSITADEGRQHGRDGRSRGA